MYITENKIYRGFTLVELLVALMVSSIIFTAVASLVFAIGAANDSADEISTNQARVRFTTVRLHDLIKHAKMVTLSGADDLAIWKSDFDGDNEIDPAEIAFIETGSGRNHIRILEFPADASGSVALADIKSGSAKTSLIAMFNETSIEVIPQCSNVVFNPANVNEQDEFVCISFNLTEQSQVHYYQISSRLLCHADNIISGGSIVTSDDD